MRGVAENEIVKRVEPGDLVITADIPLAAAVIEKGGHALNPRGELYTTENIRQRLNMRADQPLILVAALSDEELEQVAAEGRKSRESGVRSS